ncbi:MAG: zf-HC2 domain-containing protein [Clostridiaceae bacterium]|nr:zf-HC2 domain-containing protein [Clostridiaceae bacterium]
MSKYPCGLVEDLIPLYIEDDVSIESKGIVEEHLKDCINCISLVKEYYNYELKLNEFIDDLPQANTFKKWMKRLKIWGSITIIAMILGAMAIGVLGYKIGEKPKSDLLTLNTIVKTFEKRGLPLKKDTSKSPDNFLLSGVKPVIYSIGKNKDTLLVYTFKSFVEREDIVNTTNFNNPYSLQEIGYNAKNTFLVYMPSQISNTETEMKSILETKGLISNIVFKYFNDGKQIIYKGESTSWTGTFTLKYYEHWWKDETGLLTYESYNDPYQVINYKISDKESVGPIDFEYKTTVSGGTMTDLELNKEGSLNISMGSGNGAMPRENDDINFTIKWNGKEEKIVLKAQ